MTLTRCPVIHRCQTHSPFYSLRKLEGGQTRSAGSAMQQLERARRPVQVSRAQRPRRIRRGDEAGILSSRNDGSAKRRHETALGPGETNPRDWTDRAWI